LEKKNITKKGLVERLKVKALSSNPSTAKRKKKEPNMVLQAYNPSYSRGRGRRILTQRQSRQKMQDPSEK
jgi:hypothetical protein